MNKEKKYLDKLNYYNLTNDTYKINKYNYKLEQIGNGLFDNFINKIKSKIKNYKDNKELKDKIKLSYDIYSLIKNNYNYKNLNNNTNNEIYINNDNNNIKIFDKDIFNHKNDNTEIIICEKIYEFIKNININDNLKIINNIYDLNNVFSSSKTRKYKYKKQ